MKTIDPAMTLKIDEIWVSTKGTRVCFSLAELKVVKTYR